MKPQIAGSVEGNGSVTPPSGSQFEENTIVQLLPTPDTGYKFDAWGGADGELVSEDNEILMTKDMSITAGFVPLDQVATANFTPGGGAIRLRQVTSFILRLLP